jgi:sugar/nucleoside kinase (ribokinase family)
MIKFFRKNMDALLTEKMDLLFCNESEAMEYTGTMDLARCREELKKVAKTFVITLGKNGSLIYDGQMFIDIEPFAVKAVDSLGAGDMYAGAFLYAITNGHTYPSAGRLAGLASSKVVSQFGPRLNWTQAKDVLHECFGEK